MTGELLGDIRHKPGGHDHDQSKHGGGGGSGEGPGSGKGTRWKAESTTYPAATGDTPNAIGVGYTILDGEGHFVPGTAQNMKHYGAIEVSKNMTPEQKAGLEADLAASVGDILVVKQGIGAPSQGEIDMADGAFQACVNDLGISRTAVRELPVGVALQAQQVDQYLSNANPYPSKMADAVSKAVDDYNAKMETVGGRDWESSAKAVERFSKDLEAASGVDQPAGFAGALNRDWKTSASAYMSTAAQMRLAERRGMDMAETGRGGERYPRSMGWRSGGDIDSGNAFGSKYGRAFDAVADAQYAHTQAVFKAAGVTELKLYRGVRVEGTDPVTMESFTRVGGSGPELRPVAIATNPMSSWSADRATAKNFGTQYGDLDGGHVVAAKVPVHQIQATATMTGMGSAHEAEYIVMGNNEWANQYGSGKIEVLPMESRAVDPGPVYADGTINLDHPDIGGPDWIKEVASPDDDEETDVEAFIEPRHRPGGKDHDQSTHGSGAGSKVGSYVEGTGTKDDPIRTNNTAAAAKALGEGKHVQLEQERMVSTLINRLDRQVRKAKAAGEDAPNINLCGVSVKGSNLFCEDSKGVPRVRMPQLKGKPLPGSKADGMPKNDKGEVDLGPGFVEHMARRGIKTTADTVPANVLKASQNELNGAKVAGMAKAKENGTLPEGSIYVTRDDYVIDGHHRWAANVSAGISKGESLTMPVEVIDADIITVLAAANNYTHSMGIPSAGVNAQGRSVLEVYNEVLERRHKKHNQKDHAGKGGVHPDDAAGLMAMFTSGPKMSKKKIKKLLKAEAKRKASGSFMMDKKDAEAFLALEWRSTGGDDGQDRGVVGAAEALRRDDRGRLGRLHRRVPEQRGRGSEDPPCIGCGDVT